MKVSADVMSNYAIKLLQDNRHLLVPWYLMASYLYYIKDISLLTDLTYDLEVCKRLDAEWESIEHQHKTLVRREELCCGTGYYLLEADYPLRVTGAAWALVNNGLPPWKAATYVPSDEKTGKPKPKAPKAKQTGFF